LAAEPQEATGDWGNTQPHRFGSHSMSQAVAGVFHVSMEPVAELEAAPTILQRMLALGKPAHALRRLRQALAA
jgi:hypothetical protein